MDDLETLRQRVAHSPFDGSLKFLLINELENQLKQCQRERDEYHKIVKAPLSTFRQALRDIGTLQDALGEAIDSADAANSRADAFGYTLKLLSKLSRGKTLEEANYIIDCVEAEVNKAIAKAKGE